MAYAVLPYMSVEHTGVRASGSQELRHYCHYFAIWVYAKRYICGSLFLVFGFHAVPRFEIDFKLWLAQRYLPMGSVSLSPSHLYLRSDFDKAVPYLAFQRFCSHALHRTKAKHPALYFTFRYLPYWPSTRDRRKLVKQLTYRNDYGGISNGHGLGVA
jgi:hypothetical protein